MLFWVVTAKLMVPPTADDDLLLPLCIFVLGIIKKLNSYVSKVIPYFDLHP